ncbi:MAG: 16S rRNA (cytidine(1402)-2'-O)-methyltransferase [Brevinematia bacterium]
MKKIYIVATPIGNLEDITIRALEVLKKVDIILCEDPDYHLRLLSYYGIKGKRLIKVTSANEENSVNGIMKLLEEGKEVALVSNSGTPNLSDPGGIIVRELQKRGIRCIPIPGPSALTTAISVSPLPIHRFIFYGFIPKSVRKVEKVVEQYKSLGLPIVFFVPSSRIREFLGLLCEKYPHFEVVVFKELTKINEEIVSGFPCEILVEEKGEFVVVVRV